MELRWFSEVFISRCMGNEFCENLAKGGFRYGSWFGAGPQGRSVEGTAQYRGDGCAEKRSQAVALAVGRAAE